MRVAVKLNLPEFNFKTRSNSDKIEIWDDIRKRWLVLTPEEWVRQNFIRFLIDYRGVPPMMIKQEMPLNLNNTKKRADIVVYSPQGEPSMLIECKAPSIKISKDTLNQAIRYNMVLNVPCFVLTNGITHFCYSGALLEDIPHYKA